MSTEGQSVSNPKKKISLVLILAVLIPAVFSLLYFSFGIAMARAIVITVFIGGFAVYFRLHLSHEKPLVLYIIGLAFVFFIFMMFLFWLGYFSLPQGSVYVS